MEIVKKVMHAIRWIFTLGICILLGASAMAETNETVVETAAPIVKNALMCENVHDGLPVNQTIIFNMSKTSAYCWSEFDPVPADGVVYHEWYRKGVLITRKKLAVKAPRWATYSRLPLRQADIGPWHLNITDEDGNLLKTIRFSITE